MRTAARDQARRIAGSTGWGEVWIGSVGQAKENRFSLKKSKIDFDIESHNTGTNLQTQSERK